MKKCIKCNLKQSINNFPIGRNYCQPCINKHGQQYRKTLKGIANRRREQQKAQLNGKHKIRSDKYRNGAKKDIINELSNQRVRNDMKVLGDTYMKRLIKAQTNLDFIDISDEMITFKRLQVQLVRMLKK